MLCPKHTPTVLKIDQSASTIMADANNARLVAWQKLDCRDSSHGCFVQFPGCPDTNRL